MDKWICLHCIAMLGGMCVMSEQYVRICRTWSLSLDTTQIQLITHQLMCSFICLFLLLPPHIRPIGISLHTSPHAEGTLIDLLMKRFPEVDGQKQFGFSVSHTTRDPRPGEEDGVAYNFTTVEAIKKEIDAGKFLEYAEVQ